jgi:hypothetical protein
MGGIRQAKTSAGQQRIGKGKQGKHLGGVLCQAPIARLAMTEEVRQHLKPVIALSWTGAFLFGIVAS